MTIIMMTVAPYLHLYLDHHCTLVEIIIMLTMSMPRVYFMTRMPKLWVQQWDHCDPPYAEIVRLRLHIDSEGSEPFSIIYIYRLLGDRSIETVIMFFLALRSLPSYLCQDCNGFNIFPLCWDYNSYCSLLCRGYRDIYIYARASFSSRLQLIVPFEVQRYVLL